MFDPDEKKIRSVVLRLQKNRQPTWIRAGCPDEEVLATYLSGLLGEEAKGQIENHLAGCSLCMDELVAAHKAGQETTTERVPQRIMDRAMGLVPGTRREQSVLDIVVRVVKDSLELASTSGRWINPLAAVPVGVRGKQEPSKTTIIQVEKEMGRFKVGIEVERVEAGLCQVAVSVVGEDGKPADDMRVSLVSSGREQASYLARQGMAIFDRIPPSEYELAVSEAGRQIGSVCLTIMEGHHER